MFETLLSWILAAFTVYGCGLAGRMIIKAFFDYRIKRLDSVVFSGIVICTLYAQFWSLFSGLGITAFSLIFLISLIFIVICRKDPLSSGKDITTVQKAVGILIIAFITYAAAYISSVAPRDWDSYNYHAQSIRWIEEYGIVKGLGNLHTRFAYNSSFLCLQALFSFHWIGGRSMHSLNGLLWLYTISSSILSVKLFKTHKLCLSDMFKLLCVLILFRYEELYRLSSPQTDLLPMILCIKIFTDWAELYEDGEKDSCPYGLLAVLAAFAVSVKLSAASLLLFTLWPLASLLKKREGGKILKFAVTDLVMILPYCLRNLIISGYLVYPVGITALNVSWRIPAFTADTDALGIKLFARVGNDWNYDDAGLGFIQWFPLWLKQETRFMAIMIVTALICAAVIILFCLRDLAKKHVTPELILDFSASSGLLFLLFTAPSTRFGIWWIMVPTVICIYRMAERIIQKSRLMKKSPIPVCTLLILTLYSLAGFINYMHIERLNGNKELFTVFAEDYADENACEASMLISGIPFYYPDQNGSNMANGYRGFPGTERKDTLEKIRLIGENLADGFCVRDEFRNTSYDFQGMIIE